MRFLSRSEYDSVLRLALAKLGLDRTATENLLAARWPMTAIDVIAEAGGRGLIVTLGDVETYLEHVLRETGGEEESAAELLGSVAFSPDGAEKFFTWATVTGRAMQTPNGEAAEANPRFLETICRMANSPNN